MAKQATNGKVALSDKPIADEELIDDLDETSEIIECTYSITSYGADYPVDSLIKRIEAILRAVLRAGAYELGHRNDVPARVVVSEYVDVAGAFVDKDETGMVNAVLDQLARQFRAGEFQRAAR